MATKNTFSVKQAGHNASSISMEPKQGDRIYSDFYNLKGAPFSITPDPEFLFLSETHRNVIEKIQYGIQSRMGFMLLTGEVGTGKTTLCRALLDLLQNTIRTVYVINPSLDVQELLAGILDDLGIAYPSKASKKELIDRLNRCLLDDVTSRPVVIIVDDAQTMPLATLEDLRLLSNLETDKSKLLQLLLVGQPELLSHLDQPQMRQLKQRVAVSCHLDYLSCDEVGGYIERRLFIAGNQGQVRFAPKAVGQIHKQSGGVPRMINKICDLALTAAYADNSNVVGKKHLKAAAGELVELQGMHYGNGFQDRFLGRRTWAALPTVAALICALVIGFGAHDYLEHRLDPKTSLNAGPDPPTESSPQHEIKAFILQLGSFRTLANTLRAVDIYARQGIEVHWNAVQLDQKKRWYRVFAGHFSSIESARQYQNKINIKGARILFTPWAVVLGQSGSTAHMDAIKNSLQAQGMDSYMAYTHNGLSHLCTGAFVSQKRAEAIARQIHQLTGVSTRVANFHPALVSNRPKEDAIAAGSEAS